MPHSLTYLSNNPLSFSALIRSGVISNATFLRNIMTQKYV